jgi:transcriptional regulator with XRE-family HTH domain
MERRFILENIAKIRKNKGFSQEYLADKLGMKQSGYALIEKGDRGLQYELLLQIAAVFEMDVIDIIAFPKKYVDVDSIVFESTPKAEKVSITFEVSPDKRDYLLKMVLGEKREDNKSIK